MNSDISMSVVEFNGCPLTSYILNLAPHARKLITSSKIITSEYITAAKYGLSLKEHITPLTLSYKEVNAKALETVFNEEYHLSMGDENDTFMAVALGEFGRPLFSFDIYHRYVDKARYYHFGIPSGQILLYGVEEIVGKIGAAIAMHKDKEVDEKWFMLGSRSLLRATKEYGSEKVTADAG